MPDNRIGVARQEVPERLPAGGDPGMMEGTFMEIDDEPDPSA
jgi:hypothetical protein